MATVTGPLHSDQVRGTIAKRLTYKEHRGRCTIAAYSFPGSKTPYTPSASQLTIRARTGQIMKAWRTLTLEQQDTWTEPANERELQPINLFQIVNFRRLADGLELAQTYATAALPRVKTFAAQTFASNSLRPLR